MSKSINLYFCDIDGTLIETPKYILKKYGNPKNKFLLDNPYDNLNCFKDFKKYVEFYIKYIYEFSFELEVSEYIKTLFRQNLFTSCFITSFTRYYMHLELKNYITNSNSFAYIQNKNYKNDNYELNIKPNMIKDFISEKMVIFENKNINIFIFDDDFNDDYLDLIEQKIGELNINYTLKPVLIRYNYSIESDRYYKTIDYKDWFSKDIKRKILEYFY